MHDCWMVSTTSFVVGCVAWLSATKFNLPPGSEPSHEVICASKGSGTSANRVTFDAVSGTVAQWIEHPPTERKVEGSTPSCVSFFGFFF